MNDEAKILERIAKLETDLERAEKWHRWADYVVRAMFVAYLLAMLKGWL